MSQDEPHVAAGRSGQCHPLCAVVPGEAVAGQRLPGRVFLATCRVRRMLWRSCVIQAFPPTPISSAPSIAVIGKVMARRAWTQPTLNRPT